LFGEDESLIRQHVELTLSALFDLGFVLGLVVQLGRETRGPCVVTVSDGAVENAHARHRTEPTVR